MITDEALAMIAAGALPSDAPAIRELVDFYRRFAGKGLGDLAARQIELERAAGDLDALWQRVDTLYPAIAHGEQPHRDWLCNAIASHFEGVGKPGDRKPPPKKPPEVGEAIARAHGAYPFQRELIGRPAALDPFGRPYATEIPPRRESERLWVEDPVAPRRATPAEEAALRAAHELVTDPGGRRPFDSMPCPHSFIVVDKCRACGAYMGPQP